MPAFSHVSVPGVEALAARFAALAEHDGNQAIDEHALVAVRERRIDEVVLWQRVRFRAQLLRAIEQRRHDGDGAPMGSPSVSQSTD